jgi:hypothetical protein
LLAVFFEYLSGFVQSLLNVFLVLSVVIFFERLEETDLDRAEAGAGESAASHLQIELAGDEL